MPETKKIFRYSVHFIIFFVGLIMMIGCEKKESNNTGVLKGQLVGHVRLFDSTRHEMDDKSGMNVKIEGSKPPLEAISNEDGKFIIDDLSTGTYNILFEKEGFCTHKIIGYQFVGGNEPGTVNEVALYQQLNFQLDTSQVDIMLLPGNPVLLTITAQLNELNTDGYFNFIVYLSDQSDVTYQNYMATATSYISVSNELRCNYEVDTALFPRGTNVYLILYPYSGGTNNYVNLDTGLPIYTSTNINKPSEVIKVHISEN